ncbi:calcium-binding protein [Pseudovibrio sp. Alg231-02]|uniref:calcium-binding protein n=1 Tax=Pseudovibrio sp. Alg231-02 TaxID=1922223 RepID=UPI000D5557A3|nr:calcium-binding protein [Pseudovibrio sp. Alg231-02]
MLKTVRLGDGNDYYSNYDLVADLVYAGGGNDRIHTNEGNDFIHGEGGDDFLTGGNGDDTIWGEADDDYLSGDGGNDTLFGGTGDDEVSGGSGDDYLDGETGNDILYGGSGNDTFKFNRGNGQDKIIDTSGSNDTIRFGSGIELDHVMVAVDPVNPNDLKIYIIDPSNPNQITDVITLQDGASASSPIEKFEFADGTTLTKLEFQTDGTFTINGSAGNDELNGSIVNDTMLGGEGNDVIRGGSGNDTLLGGEGSDVLQGGDGDDTLDGGAGVDFIRGGSGINNIVTGGADTDVFMFGPGDGLSVVTDFTDGVDLIGYYGEVAQVIQTAEVTAETFAGIASLEGKYIGSTLVKIDDSFAVLDGFSTDQFSGADLYNLSAAATATTEAMDLLA